MTEFIPAEKGVPIREASTANLLIDSIDRLNADGTPKGNETSADFIINKNNSILNGYFTRIAITEVYLDWCIDNISETTDNNVLTFTIPTYNSGNPFSITLPNGQYTVAQCLDTAVDLLNTDLSGTGFVFSLVNLNPGIKGLNLKSGGVDLDYRINSTNLQAQLNLLANDLGNDYPINCPKLLPYTYLDFTSTNLTYNQELQDQTTNLITRNVLYRWYFAWDNPAPVDAYGYPIFQGYQKFITRRYLSFPKQIRWSANQPIGQLQFQVYTSQGTLLEGSGGMAGEFEWAITCLISEV